MIVTLLYSGQERDNKELWHWIVAPKEVVDGFNEQYDEGKRDFAAVEFFLNDAHDLNLVCTCTPNQGRGIYYTFSD